MHKLQHNSCINSTEKYKFQIFHFCIDRAIVNQLTLLLHRLLHEVKIVQTILDEYLDTETVSRKILNQWPWLFSSYLIFSVASPYSDGCISNPAKQRVYFSYLKNVIARASHVQSSGWVGVTSFSNTFQLSLPSQTEHLHNPNIVALQFQAIP